MERPQRSEDERPCTQVARPRLECPVWGGDRDQVSSVAAANRASRVRLPQRAPVRVATLGTLGVSLVWLGV